MVATTLKDGILGIVKERGKISASLLVEVAEVELDASSDQAEAAISHLLNDGEIKDIGRLIPTDSPTAWVMKTIYTMPDSFYQPEIKWETGACLSFICPWKGTRKRFCSGKWQRPVTFATRHDQPTWVVYPIHHMDRNNRLWRVERKLKTASQMDGYNYFLVDKDGETYQLREINDCD